MAAARATLLHSTPSSAAGFVSLRDEMISAAPMAKGRLYASRVGLANLRSSGRLSSKHISVSQSRVARRVVVAAATSSVESESADSKKSDWKDLRVAYQGVPGAYSEMAVQLAYDGCEPAPCDQFEEAFQAVESWLVDRAVLPVENSLGGSIHRNFDLLLRHRLHIVGEVNLPVNHCLLAPPGTTKENLKRVLSHPQALAQCENYLDDLGVIKEAMHDTAGAAQLIQNEELQFTGAVASSRAAELYGMNVLDHGIQDDSNNITRFIALARAPYRVTPGKQYKTSIVFSLEEGPGVLFKALACFALRNIDLTKMESRPMRSKPIYTSNEEEKRFQYLFYVDFKASMADAEAQNALSNLEEMTTFLRVLGCYPMADS
uniref:Arogenate dehydratase n=1 Tax=Pyramimonas obovata TaxID=1411642 RepID=A0A7S0QXA7_9CHLO|mmetsp:Transcript_15656/g.33936  ORF Transcript_15656/g.33936 Transcript_15656/m.33936 type:complete len:375 (+) Transcript_15656:120-1244(+)|eukprot:CAMPEP_0118926766 /NCGR_PEP_ID=MMETSP1169-20130426/4382_1 /TAXON_ID=36882 /ORGANISM="Pyramimonas obovata, Strain CCMP722" /LENGTH=374 /DNA_ID=CAMNT_0006868387 /DNA_START=113 /DNA_END=1237 /DNA_ORIENTATION=+